VAELQVEAQQKVDDNNVEESISAFFTSKGHRPLPLDGISAEGKKPELAFTDGLNTTCLRVLRKSSLQARNKLLKAAMDSVSFTSTANKVYIALPKVYATILDAAVLREQGLGLMLYDERGVEEVLPPKLFEHRSESKPSLEIEQLKRRILALEKGVETLSSELIKIRSMKSLQLGPKSLEPNGPPVVGPSKPDLLPSFFEGNPWIDILSKRGREPEQVAG